MQTEGERKTEICLFAKSRHRERDESAREREKRLCVESEKERLCVVRAGQKKFVLVSIDLDCVRREGGRE
jgi:hypothetical protein